LLIFEKPIISYVFILWNRYKARNYHDPDSVEDISYSERSENNMLLPSVDTVLKIYSVDRKSEERRQALIDLFTQPVRYGSESALLTTGWNSYKSSVNNASNTIKDDSQKSGTSFFSKYQIR